MGERDSAFVSHLTVAFAGTGNDSELLSRALRVVKAKFYEKSHSLHALRRPRKQVY